MNQLKLDEEWPTPKSEPLKRKSEELSEEDHTEDIAISDEENDDDLEEIINDAIANWMDLNLETYLSRQGFTRKAKKDTVLLNQAYNYRDKLNKTLLVKK